MAVRRVVVGAIVVLLLALAALAAFVFFVLPRLGGAGPESGAESAQETPAATSTPAQKADFLNNLSVQSSSTQPSSAQTEAQMSAKAKVLNTINASGSSRTSVQSKIDLLNSLNKNK